MDPYEELGISSEASPEEITKAYRAQSLQHHPDRGGDGVKFRQLTVAYEVLSDSTKRSHYDQTGETDSPNHGFELAMGLFNHVVVKIVESGTEPSQVDLIGKMQEALSTELINATGEIHKREKRIKKLNKIRKRIKRKKGEDGKFQENYFSKSIDAEIHKIKDEIRGIETRIEHLQQAREITESYDYEHSPPETTTQWKFVAFNGTSTSTTT